MTGTRMEVGTSAAGASAATPETARPDWWAGRTPMLLLLGAIAVFQLATIRVGHIWGDDHALYILHARALLEGRNYADTGFIYSPENPWYSTRIYPPGFPLMLLPVLAAFGLNIIALKLVVVVCLVGAAALLAVLVRRELPGPWALVPVALFGFSPYLTDFKDNVLPDLPFITFVLLSLLLLHALADRAGQRRWQGLALGILAGIVIWYAIALRTIGIVLFGAIPFSLLLRRRWPSPALLVAVGTAGALVLLQRALMPPASGYTTQIASAVSQHGAHVYVPQLDKLQSLATETFLLWNGPPQLLRNVLGTMILALALVGFVLRLRRPTVTEAFVVAYGAAIFLFPVANLRYVLPLVPALLLYATLAVCRLVARARRPAVIGATGLGLALTATYGAQFARTDFGPITRGSDSPVARELYSAVRACTAPDDRLLFSRPRALTLYTRRPALAVPPERTDLAQFLDVREIDVVVATRGDRLERFARDPANGLYPVYATSRHLLFRYVDPTVAAVTVAPCSPPGT